MRSIAITIAGAAAALALLTTCAKPQYSMQHRTTGTCEGACDYYLACARTDNENTQQACISECSATFSESPQALRELERLECEELVSFIEGPTGRPPGY